jgi:hypothetical protein
LQKLQVGLLRLSRIPAAAAQHAAWARPLVAIRYINHWGAPRTLSRLGAAQIPEADLVKPS